MWKPIVSSVWLVACCAALFAAACGEDEPGPVSEAVERGEDVEPAVEAVERASRVEEGEESAAAVEPTQESEARSTGGTRRPAVAEVEEDDEAEEDLTDVPGVVLADADVRIRPGLAWPAVDLLTAGESVSVLHAGGGWYRISYGDGLAGWIRSTAVDLGDVDEWSVLRQAAPAILAEWRGVEYGVMGQSADGAEVRLLAVDDELSEILGAPMDEVTLLADDVTLDDLPILIGDETVVYPGDDFRAGQGRILPKANEWVWLPWGWLLAHNDDYIWQWRPETDELEFIRRPPGYARLSPDGRYLAIADLCFGYRIDCPKQGDVQVLPLDGSPPISLLRQLREAGWSPVIFWDGHWPRVDMEWAPNSTAVKLYIEWQDEHSPPYPGSLVSLVFHVDGQVVRFEEWTAFQAGGKTCMMTRYIDDYGSHWEIRADNTITSGVRCTDADGKHQGHWVGYALSGEFLGFDFQRPWRQWDHGAAHIRTAASGDTLGDEVITRWSPDEQYALVVDTVAGHVWVYDAEQHELTLIRTQVPGRSDSRLWSVPDPPDDFYAASVWHDRHVGIAITNVWGVRAVMVIDVASLKARMLDFGGPAAYQDWGGTQSWSPDGATYHILLDRFRPADGLAMRVSAGYQPLLSGNQLLIFAEETDAIAALNIDVARRANWSPNGNWFAVSGRE